MVRQLPEERRGEERTKERLAHIYIGGQISAQIFFLDRRKFVTESVGASRSRSQHKEELTQNETGKMLPLKTLIILLAAIDQLVTATQQQHANQQQQVDDILKDTMQLLDALDQKLATVQNKTPNALMRDNLRALENPAPAAEEVSSGEDLLIAGGGKQARQLLEENQQLATSDSTERHLKFTLDLMQAVFASHSSSPASASQKDKQEKSIDSFLVSPLSVQMVLMMMHLGARGQTKRELGNCLHLGPDKQAAAPTEPPAGGSNKLKRRNQHTPEKPPRQSQQQQRHQSAGAHELFGAAVRNLLKDQSVLKALTSANQVFLQKNLPLAQQFEWAIKNYYATDVKLVDFQSQSSSNTPSAESAPVTNGTITTTTENKQADAVQQVINDWIERQSRGKISNFLSSPVPVSTLLMAINVIYFKGDWQYKFDPADTEPDAWFTQASGRQVKMPMMVSRLPLAYAHDVAMRTSVIELPYRAQRLGLFLLLPDETAGIFNTMQQLNSSSFAHLISSMRKPQPTAAATTATSASSSTAALADLNGNGINIRIPKFSIESSPRLSQVLSQQLGLKTLFTPDTADLSGMFQLSKARSNKTEEPTIPQVGMDELIHKAVLQVDEQGSVAAATSATIVERVGTFSGNYFEADHPFLLFLMDKQTGLVLFSGVFAGNNQQQLPTELSSACNKKAGSLSAMQCNNN